MRTVPGRVAELQRLVPVCRAATAGSGALILVTGEAGIGKSLMVSTLADSCGSLGMAVARGWCIDDPGAPALWPWQRLSRQVPALTQIVEEAREDPPNIAGLRLTDTVADALADAAVDGGLCVVLEDLHWADSLSLDVLRRLLPELDRLPVVVVATSREEGIEGSALGRTIERLLRAPCTTHVSLAGLSVEDVATWLEADEQLREWAPRSAELVRLTGGNPFYIRSVATQLDPAQDLQLTAELAERHTWRSMLTTGFRSLPDATRRTVAMAAVLGERLSPSLLSGALELDMAIVSSQLSSAVSAGILHFGATGLAFNHSLVRDAIAVQLGSGLRADLHAAAGRALEATGDPLAVGPAAVHWSQVPGAHAARRCRDLASAAAATLTVAPERGLALARLALTSADGLDAGAEERAELVLAVARLEWAAGRLHDALRSCETGMRLAESAVRPDLMADFALVPQGIGSTDTHRAVGEMCRRALLELPGHETLRRARLLAQSAVSLVEAIQVPPLLGQPHAGPTPRQLSADALAAARESGDPQAELEAIAAHHFILSYPQAIDERSELTARALELRHHSRTVVGELWGLIWAADLALQRGDHVLVPQLVTQLDDVADRRASPIARWHARRLESVVATLTGRFEEARRQARACRDLAERVGDVSMIGMHHAFHVQLAHLRGDPGDLLPGNLDLMMQVSHIPLVRAGLPLVYTLLGEANRARTEFLPLRDLPARMPLGPRWFGTVGQIGFGAVAVGDADVARECHRLLAPLGGWCAGDGGGAPFGSGSVDLELGRLALTFGDLDLAAGHFSAGIATDDRIGARPFAALGRLHLAECLEGADLPRASALVATAASEFAELDMPGPSARATALLTRLDAASGVRAVPVERPGGLSVRELEVSRLVAEGLSNQEIAQRLFLSVRTVESHVRSALGRLDLTTRTQLAVWVDRHPD